MMTNKIARCAALIVVTQAGLACSRFVFHEDKFTPDPAPASETLVSGRDTTYVLKAPSYYLLSSQRDALWNREVLDDVAWRYHELFGDAPLRIAIRLDSAAVADSSTTWRGVPFAHVALRRHTETAPEAQHARRSRGEVDDSARVQMFARPMLAATAAETWLRARTLDVSRVADTQPGGPVGISGVATTLPVWIETGALAILGGGGAEERANDEVRADPKHVVPLASLFATTSSARPNAMQIMRAGANRFGMGQAGRRHDAATRTQELREDASGASPLFISQSVSVLTFLHDRDPGIVPKLADELARGGSIPDVLVSSTTLPHDVAGLDTAWREWLKHSPRAHR